MTDQKTATNTPPAHSPAEDKPPAPTCCQTCNYYMPQSWTVAGRQCAVFGSIDGIRDNRCGARAPRPEQAKASI